MKKNKSMRLAGGLMIATMLSTSIVSGTYAKYVTSDNAEDSARVAKFGVTVTAAGSLFDKTYLSADENSPGGDTTDAAVLSVVSSAKFNDSGEQVESDKLVAPGTKNTEGITFTIAGTPEVDVRLDVVVDDDSFKEIFLKSGTYPDMTTGKVDDKFDNTADYYPVKLTLTQDNGDGTSTLVDGGKLSDVEDALEGLTNNSIDANTDLASEIGTLNLTWEWDFEGNDKADTLLGDLAAGTTLVPDTTLIPNTDYCLDESIKISISVTQLD